MQFPDEALEAAKPVPAPAEPLPKQKQLYISSFFVANNPQQHMYQMSKAWYFQWACIGSQPFLGCDMT